MTTLLLDTHALYWWSADPLRISPEATRMISGADELAVSAISWLELGWLAQNSRIAVPLPIASWLNEIAVEVRTIPITPTIAATAVALPSSFPGDPMDRLIYATAVEHGIQLLTKDEQMLAHPSPRRIAVW